MTFQEFLKPAINLSLRSIMHIFISGSLFFFFKSHFNLSLSLGVITAFLTATTNEVVEAINKVENSFHTQHVFKRDRIMAGLVFIYTTIIIKLHWLFATLLAPLSLIALTSYMDSKLVRGKSEKRNFIKPVVDVLSLTFGPIACILLLGFISQ